MFPPDFGVSTRRARRHFEDVREVARPRVFTGGCSCAFRLHAMRVAVSSIGLISVENRRARASAQAARARFAREEPIEVELIGGGETRPRG
jgi:hypothetical protein